MAELFAKDFSVHAKYGTVAPIADAAADVFKNSRRLDLLVILSSYGILMMMSATRGMSEGRGQERLSLTDGSGYERVYFKAGSLLFQMHRDFSTTCRQSRGVFFDDD